MDSTMTAVTASTGDTWQNTGQEMLVINNGNGSPTVVTIPLPCGGSSPDGNAITSKTVSVAAGKVEFIGPFPVGQYNDATGVAKATCSVTASVTVGVFKFPSPPT